MKKIINILTKLSENLTIWWWFNFGFYYYMRKSRKYVKKNSSRWINKVFIIKFI